MRSFLCMRRAQQCRARRQSAAVLPSHAPHDSKARLQPVTTRTTHGEAMYTVPTLRRLRSHSSLRLPMCGVEGEGPSSFLSGVVKGDTLFREREYPPFTHSRTVRESSSCTSAGKKLFYASGVKIPFSVTSIVQRISCSSTGTSGDMSCSRQMSTVGQWSCGSRRS